MRIRLLCLLSTAVSLSACDAQERVGESNGEVVRGTPPDAAVAVGTRSSDLAVRGAAAALADGSPWTATTRIAPALADAGRRTPEALLVAARAAAGWEGWSEVERLLAGATWLDTLAGGEGRELLARAALARNADTLARAHAATAVRVSAPARRGARLVLLARAHDRIDALDSAAATYLLAADRLPDIAEWLRLRAAGVTANDEARSALLAGLRSPVVRARIGATEALALERSVRFDDAARAWTASGDRVSALRVRLLGARDEARRVALRGELLAVVRDRAGSADGRRAIALLDEEFTTLTADEDLVVARASMRAGDAARAVRGFAHAGASLSMRDRYDLGLSFGRLGRWRESRLQLDRVSDPKLAGEAAYHRARALYHLGDHAGARRELSAVATRYAADANASTLALGLLADLQGDAGRDADARATLLTLVRRHPTSARAAEASFTAAILALVGGAHAVAARELDAHIERWPRSTERLAATYWSGRAHLASGNAAVARARWASVIEREPLSYYAMLARTRLRTDGWRPAPAVDVTALDEVSAARERIGLLDAVGLDAEARFEVDALVRDASRSSERRRAVADALRDVGRTSASIDLGWKLIEGGATDAAAYRLAFPVVRSDRLVDAARRRGLDPALVAALIRQESSFNPRARSRVGARGLMQIMPSVGRSLARAQRFPVWDAAVLYDPDASLTLGTAHLAGFLRQYDDLTRALAAYNAGPSRVRRWSTKRGTGDPELFTERIPFEETRDYVRIVRRNAEVYRALYGY